MSTHIMTNRQPSTGQIPPRDEVETFLYHLALLSVKIRQSRTKPSGLFQEMDLIREGPLLFSNFIWNTTQADLSLYRVTSPTRCNILEFQSENGLSEFDLEVRKDQLQQLGCLMGPHLILVNTSFTFCATFQFTVRSSKMLSEVLKSFRIRHPDANVETITNNAVRAFVLSYTYAAFAINEASSVSEDGCFHVKNYNPDRTCRAQMAGYPTMKDEGKGMCRYWLKDQNRDDNDHGRCCNNVVTICKEWVNILFAGTRWGKTAKGPKAFTAESVFINADLDPTIIGEEVYLELTVPDQRNPEKRVARYPDFLFLTRYNETGIGPMFTMVTEPDDVETFIGHVSGPQGQRSNLTRVEVVRQATIHVDMMVLRDQIQHHHWPILLLTGQEEGLGAMRSQGYGRFDTVRFESEQNGKYAPLEDFAELSKKIDRDEILADYQKTKKKMQESGELSEEGTEHLVAVGSVTKNGRGRPKKA